MTRGGFALNGAPTQPAIDPRASVPCGWIRLPDQSPSRISAFFFS